MSDGLRNRIRGHRPTDRCYGGAVMTDHLQEPRCPFPMGAKVLHRTGATFTVSGWRYSKTFDKFMVLLDDDVLLAAPENLELVPQPEPVEVGQWWADSPSDTRKGASDDT